jgi:N-acetylglucosaminyl-diphospho-decaprenol L-rhamnosyltransferase
MNTPELSIIVVNWNTRDLLAQCLVSLHENITDLSFDVWVVDNASQDDSVDMVGTSFPKVHIITNTRNEGFARANNQAMYASRGRFMLLLNSDAAATSGAIQALLSLAQQRPSAGIVGAQLINCDGSFQASHSRFPSLRQEFLILTGLGRLVHGRWYPSHGPEENKSPRQVDYVEGACLLVRRQALEHVGGLDEDYFMYAEDVDWCYAMQQCGWEVWYHPGAQIIHHGSGSSRHLQTQREANLCRSRVRFFRKHYGNTATFFLKILIYCLTTAKFLVHGLLRCLSRGHCGRRVIGMRDLIHSLRDV